MSSHATVSPGSASRWGPLWGARPDDWALSEDQQLPTYEAALERTWLEPGWRVLEAAEYPDAETLGRALLAAAGLATLAGPERRPNGSYRLENEYHYLIARA